MSLWHGMPPPPKFPFWDAIITQTYGSVDIPAGTGATVTIQPPVGETWLVDIDFVLETSVADCEVGYRDFDGITARYHTWFISKGVYGSVRPHIGVRKILTNTLYAQLFGYNADAVARLLNYGYSGFKLSKPLWSAKRVNPLSKPWKQRLTKPFPEEIKGLEKYGADVFIALTGEYVSSIILEEDTVLAVDPVTGFSIERLTAFVTVKNLMDILTKRDDPMLRRDIILEVPPRYKGRKMRRLDKEEFEEVTGYKKYFEKWRAEGITI